MLYPLKITFKGTLGIPCLFIGVMNTREFHIYDYHHFFRVPCHIVHLSSASALPMIREARKEGVPITIETTHHYLSLLAEDVPDGATQFKCCPPVREAGNQVQYYLFPAKCKIEFKSSNSVM